MRIKQLIENGVKKVGQVFIRAVPLLVITVPALADNKYNIGGDTSGGFGLITAFFQKYVDFMTGPFAHAAIAVSLIVGIVLWAVMPKQGAMGIVVRVVVAAIVVLNVATWMGMFGTS